MTFPFSHICDLLQQLEDNQLTRRGVRPNASIVQEWFNKHRPQLQRDEVKTATILSTLLPEKRTDRVYNIREKKLQTLIGRGLGLGRSRIAQLGRWTNHEAGVDLADCVEMILKETPNPLGYTIVTVEEIDKILHKIAASCRFSSPSVRSSASRERLADHELHLGVLYRRLSARDAKWLTRLILKNYEPIVLDANLVCRHISPLLPAILKVQDDFTVAGRILDTQKCNRTVTGTNELAEYLKPSLGVKVGRQTWIKGRSIKHVLSMGNGLMSCEEKLDGEYCQIHIDLGKGRDCIQIFSKSGKDSTMDRVNLHNSIRNSLRIGEPDCPFKKGCILEGELVVWSDKDQKVLDFHKIRKHVSRSGSFIGTARDSQTHFWEHLMIVYYDVLLVDDESLLAAKHYTRFRRLEELVTVVQGRSGLVKRSLIDFNSRTAVSDLRRAFAKCITAREEGLVIKSDDPYFDFSATRRPYSCCAIKLKKEYVGNFGDVGDFAVVGGRFDAAKAKSYNIPILKWTHFYVGCLENRDEVRRFGKRPKFVVTNVVTMNPSQLETLFYFVNPESIPLDQNTAIELKIAPGIDEGRRPQVVFPTPAVVDLRCFSFDKEGNTGFWTPRFPMVNKVHCDRTYQDALSFHELQQMAMEEKEAPRPDDSQEMLGWIAALEKADPKATTDVDTQSTVATTAVPATPSQRSPECSRENLLRTPQLTASQASSVRAPNNVPQSAPSRSFAETRSPNRAEQGDWIGSSQGQKRSCEASELENAEDRSKSRRCSHDPSVSSGSFSQRSDATIPSGGHREPLEDVSANSSRRNHVVDRSRPSLSTSFSMPQPFDESRLSDVSFRSSFMTSMSFHESTEPASEGSQSTQLSNTIQLASFRTQSSVTSSHGSCKYFPEECALSTYSILLSPCIVGFPWVTEDLLSVHGITEFIQNPNEWKTAQFTSKSSSTAASSGSQPGRRKRKLVLVDARRKDATRRFLQSIEDAKLSRSNGDREYVPVYDWRVLEVLKEEERKTKGRRGKYEPRFEMKGPNSFWKKFWVGLA
ncbi:hypothetical protein QBC42DRAFT_236600 [Cladorrhinum samala]|uniref:ATP-dependent DNA ligase family profile domain-containing protein n=1 Tax=Cladorrhinum samala TaxID=585594 RepID=A0AAV9HC65_9PEZI|nr:hypothetical protein QBC42DRAFT_236600 [Cladorrhinum samala]